MSVVQLKAIETVYKGCRFRSRLEARWAVLFESLGVVWEYEKQGFECGDAGRYLPDFWLPAQKMHVEVKGDETLPEKDWLKIRALRDSGQKLVIVHDIPAPGEYRQHDGFDFGERAYPIDHKVTPATFAATLREDGPCDDFGLQFECPVCGDTYVHFGEVKELDGKNHYEAWIGRGDAVRVGMWCESGHEWDLQIGFHKGETFLSAINFKEQCADLPLYLADGDRLKRNQACTAARSARFEHGESPR